MSLSESLLQPIAGSKRAGEYLRYDPLYDRIKDARREDPDLPQGPQGVLPQSVKKADWPLVVRLTTEALAKQSKDLQLAAWLTEGLLRRDGFGGLREGFELILGLIEQYWDDLYPELEDGDAELRAVSLQWLAQSLSEPIRAAPLNAAGHSWLDYGQALQVPTEAEANADKAKREARKQAVEEGKATPEEFEAGFQAAPKAWYKQLVADLDASLAVLDAVERLADDRFGSDAPSFSKLREVLQQVRGTAGQLLARKLEADPDATEVEEVIVDLENVVAEVSGGTTVIAEASGPDGGTPSPSTATPQSLDEVSARVAAAARFLRAQSPFDPAPYLMLRGYRWGELRRTPGEIDPRLLEAPSTAVRSRLKELLLDERWTEALELGEEVMAAPSGRGWLDLQRYSVTACDMLGGDYDVLGRALRSTLRALLSDLPQLPSLTLLDDSPTANPDTLRWMRAEALIADRAVPVDGMEDAAAGGLQSSGRDPFDRALGLARQGHLQRAVELLASEAAREPSERGRLLRRTQAASIMVEAGLESVALPLLNEIVARIDSHQLENWEAGETVALPLDLLYRCIARLNPEDSSLQELYLRICRLDPLRAIQLQVSAQNGDSGG